MNASRPRTPRGLWRQHHNKVVVQKITSMTVQAKPIKRLRHYRTSSIEDSDRAACQGPAQGQEWRTPEQSQDALSLPRQDPCRKHALSMQQTAQRMLTITALEYQMFQFQSRVQPALSLGVQLGYRWCALWVLSYTHSRCGYEAVWHSNSDRRTPRHNQQEDSFHTLELSARKATPENAAIVNI
jgi:hypothetical protein